MKTLSAIIITFLLLSVPAVCNAVDRSIAFDKVSVNTNSSLNGQQSIEVNIALSINGYRNQPVICRIFIYDSTKDFLKTRSSNQRLRYGATDTYSNSVELIPNYDYTTYKNIYFHIMPGDVQWSTGDYQIAVFIMDPSTNKSLPGGMATETFYYGQNSGTRGYTASSTPKSASSSASQASTSTSSSTSSSSANPKGYYYFKNSKTGEVQLAHIHNVDEHYGGGQTITTCGSVFTYAGRVNGRDKWSTFTIQQIYEYKNIPGFGRPVKIGNGSKRIPDNKTVIFTAPDMSAIYTITGDTYTKISREEWLAKNEQSSPSTNGTYTNSSSGSSSSNGSTYYEPNRSQYAQCRHCHGSGRCSTCNGTGDRGDSHNRQPDKVVWKCTTCSGNGRCMFCNGSGRIRN